MRRVRLQFRVRTFLVVIAVLSPIMAGLACLIHIAMALEEFYGEGGVLDREHDAAVKAWKIDHPNENYPVNAPTSP